jgi:hypothetical protein
MLILVHWDRYWDKAWDPLLAQGLVEASGLFVLLTFALKVRPDSFS